MIVPWTIGGLLTELTAQGGHPAIIAFREDGVLRYSLQRKGRCLSTPETRAAQSLTTMGWIRPR